MNLSQQITKHFRDVYFGGNWTSVYFKDTLSNITWQQAQTKIDSFNTIAVLVFHTHYYVNVVTKVLQGGTLDASDKFSFDCPEIKNEADWQQMLDKTFSDAEVFAQLIEALPDSIWNEDFAGGKYGNYYRNITGIIEHCHYHLGQITLLKKMVTATETK